MYIDVEGDIAPKLLGNVAARFERYSDFGKQSQRQARAALPAVKGHDAATPRSHGVPRTVAHSVVLIDVVNNSRRRDDRRSGAVRHWHLPRRIRRGTSARSAAAQGRKSRNFQHWLRGDADAARSPSTLISITSAVYDRIVLTGFSHTRTSSPLPGHRLARRGGAVLHERHRHPHARARRHAAAIAPTRLVVDSISPPRST